jgi:YVTN family beta-propeller protein
VVTIIDTASWSVDANVPTGDFPAWVAFSGDGSRIFVSVKNEDQVEVIDTTLATPAVVAQINVGDQPWHLEPDLASGRLYVNIWGDSRVGIVDTNLNVLATTRNLIDRAVGLHLDRAAGVLYTADGTSSTTLGGTVGFERTESGRVQALAASNLVLNDTIPLDCAPSALAFNDAGTRAVLACPTGDGAVLIVGDGPCNDADIAEPFGVLDLGDIQAFVTAFLGTEPAADLAAPFGVWDLADIQAFVIAFNAGCP